MDTKDIDRQIDTAAAKVKELTTKLDETHSEIARKLDEAITSAHEVATQAATKGQHRLSESLDKAAHRFQEAVTKLAHRAEEAAEKLSAQAHEVVRKMDRKEPQSQSAPQTEQSPHRALAGRQDHLARCVVGLSGGQHERIDIPRAHLPER